MDAPEITDTRSGAPVANMRILVPSRDQGAQFYMFNVRAYDDPAVEIDKAEYMAGDEVEVHGFLKQERWTHRTTGEDVSRVVIMSRKTQMVTDDNA